MQRKVHWLQVPGVASAINEGSVPVTKPGTPKWNAAIIDVTGRTCVCRRSAVEAEPDNHLQVPPVCAQH